MTSTQGPRLRGLFKSRPVAMPNQDADPVGDALRAAVDTHERVLGAECETYEARFRDMFDDLFAKLERRDENNG